MPLLRRSPRSLLLAGLLGVTACGASDPPAPQSPPAVTSSPAAPPPAPSASARFDYPAARRDAVSETIFGTRVDDPYRWLEDGSSPEVQRWLHAEGDYASAKLAALPGRDAFAARLAELLYVPEHGIPRHRGSRLFFSRRDGHAEKEIIYWAELGAGGKPGPEKVLLDPNTWSTDGSLSLHAWSVSRDGKLVAYEVNKNNADEGEIHVLDVATGKARADVVRHVKFGWPSWNGRGDAFVYTYVPAEADGKPIPAEERAAYSEVRLHVLGTPAEKDQVLRGKTGDAKLIQVGFISEDGHWLFVEVARGANHVDVYFRDLRRSAALTALVVDQEATSIVHAFRDRFYIQTNLGAPHGKVMVADPGGPDPASWKTVIPERPDEIVSDVDIVGGKLSVAYIKDVATRLEVHDLTGALEDEIALPGLGMAYALVGQQTDQVGYYSYGSYTHPKEIFAYDVRTKKSASFFRPQLPMNPDDYVAEEGFAPSKDGTRIPVFVVHRKDVQKSKGRPLPTILYGYGGFDVAETPEFSSTLIPWLDKGGVFAMSSLRGGSEYGESWHEHGRRHEKQNVFDDAIGAGEWLIREGWTDKAHLVARGGSNGGLLVGALVTQRPDLFAVGLCGVPLLDMLRYDRFGAGKFWIDEYGTATKAEDFATLYAYSPYHHVTAGTRYPALLLLSADSDDRVDPMHARKFAAAMQAASTGGPVLLRIEKNSGHGGADTTKSRVAERADEYAFALANMPTAP